MTVQSTIEKALSLYLRESIAITGCGRTDTGVHARDYYAHFDVEVALEDKLHTIYRLNKMLPADIAVHDIILMHSGAHARFDAVSRSYEYHLHTSKSPFLPHSYYYPYNISNLDIMNEAAALLLQQDDFSTFCKHHTDAKSMICKISMCHWSRNRDSYIFKITSDRFLRGMIRLIVGMCLHVSAGKLTVEDVKNALAEKRRTGHDWSVPAEGLWLCDIKYPYLTEKE